MDGLRNEQTTSRLVSTSRNYSKRMEDSLAEVYSEYDLSAEELNQAHILFNDKNTTLKDLLEKTEIRRSEDLTANSIKAIHKISSAYEQFLIKMFAQETDLDEEVQKEISYFFIDSKTESKIRKQELYKSSIELVFKPVYKYQRFNQLKKQWAELLKKTAIKRIGSIEAEFVNTAPLIPLAEIELLMENPWKYTEKLIGIYNDSHQEIISYADKTKDALIKVFARID